MWYVKYLQGRPQTIDKGGIAIYGNTGVQFTYVYHSLHTVSTCYESFFVPSISSQLPLAMPSLSLPYVQHDLCIQPHSIQFVGYGERGMGGRGELKLTASPVPRLRNPVALSFEAWN
jgi:hypothetical protein